MEKTIYKLEVWHWFYALYVNKVSLVLKAAIARVFIKMSLLNIAIYKVTKNNKQH